MKAPVRTYNVLLVTDFLDKADHAVVIGLSKSHIHTEIICDPHCEGQKELVKAGIHIYPHDIKHRLDVKAITYVRGLLKKKNYRIVYALRNNALSVSLFASMGQAVKIVGYRGTIGHLGLLNPESLITYLHPRVDKIICVSNAVKRYMASKSLPAAKLITIYKGHDTSWYHKEPPHPLPSTWPMRKNAFVVGFVGNIRPVKGVDTLIKAIVKYIPESENIHLVIIGEIREARLKKMLGRQAIAARCHCLGFKKNAARYMKNFNAFVMPSIAREGLPQALIEAMAQQIPPIVSNVGGMPEVVSDQESGLIVPPGDPKKLAEAILFLFHHPAACKAIGAKAKDRIEAFFNVTDTIQQTIALFDELHSISL